MERILAQQAATLAATWYAGGSAAVDPGVVTVHVVNGAGTDVKAAGSATTGEGAAARSVTLTAAQLPRPDELTATWSSATLGTRTSRAEVVGGWHLELATLRGELDDAAKYPDPKLAAGRLWWEQLAERRCGVAFVPRWQRVKLRTDRRRDDLLLPLLRPRAVRWASVDGTDVDVAAWTVHQSGYVELDITLAAGAVVTLGVEHGHDQPPDDLIDAALVAIVDKVRYDRSKRDRRILSETNQFGGATRWSTESAKRPTGIPEVDAALEALAETYPTIG